MNIPADHKQGFDLSKQADRLILTSLLASQGFPIRERRIVATDHGDAPEPEGDPIKATVADFQACHRDADGKPLVVDGVVGPKTTWALFNPSGKAQATQASGKLIEPAHSITPTRISFIRAMVGQVGVHEIPDGANWGGGVEKILQHAGGPRAWCCHLISYAWKQATGSYPFGQDWGLVAAFLGKCREEGVAFKRDEYSPKSGDFGVILYRNKDTGNYDGTGHIFAVVDADETGPVLTIGGNEGNAVRWGSRDRKSGLISHWINLHGDGKQFERLKIVEGKHVIASDDSQDGTR